MTPLFLLAVHFVLVWLYFSSTHTNTFVPLDTSLPACTPLSLSSLLWHPSTLFSFLFPALQLWSDTISHERLSLDLRERGTSLHSRPLLRSLSLPEFPTFESSPAFPESRLQLFCKTHQGQKNSSWCIWRLQSDSSLGAEAGSWGDAGGLILYSMFPVVLEWAENNITLQSAT